ncbi:lysophospholipid acyltransferase family protein [Chitinilyticum litopenaei]|uniref:lysophospholipid acyltransferase family protein n=1 Tax=Chitinilyticum litopenaei TaxID=1121276 RepID=UPI00041C30AC|nr:lysophospholipid acyltransferase family protein [Chitinilyticum litopenaei]
MPVLTLTPAQPAARRLPGFARASWRLARLLAHILRGVLIANAGFERRDSHERQLVLRTWSQQLLGILGIRVELGAAPASLPDSKGCLLLANHVSWLDIFAINTVCPSRFVAKSEIRDWPVLGKLVSKAGTLYIQRNSRAATASTKREIDHYLTRGESVAFFPEGTTSDGSGLKPFRGGLLQSALDQGVAIQPILLRYRAANGRLSQAAAYIDDVSLLASLWRLACEPYTIVELHFLAPRSGLPATRKEMIRQLEEEMRLHLQAA